MKKTNWRAAITSLATLAIVTVTPWSAMATQIPDSGFKPTFEFENGRLFLSGVGVLKYLGFIRIYNGALYLPPEVGGDEALGDIPKRLEVQYLRSFKAEDFGAATNAGMRKNVGPEVLSKLQKEIAAHNRLYQDIKPGDRVSLTYIPTIGTQVAINGVPRGTIQGAAFAKALFSLWLGEKPFDIGFKRALLGKE